MKYVTEVEVLQFPHWVIRDWPPIFGYGWNKVHDLKADYNETKYPYTFTDESAQKG
jgi:hypothetical protein